MKLSHFSTTDVPWSGDLLKMNRGVRSLLGDQVHLRSAQDNIRQKIPLPVLWGTSAGVLVAGLSGCQ